MAENNRVYEVAKQHGISSKQLLEVLQELGVVAKSHMSVLSEEDRELVEKHFSELEAKGEKVAEKSRRVEVEKGGPRKQRMSAREKLAAKLKEKEERARAQKEAREQAEKAPAAEDSPAAEDATADAPRRPSLRKVSDVVAEAQRRREEAGEASRPAGAGDEPKEPARKSLARVQMPKPAPAAPSEPEAPARPSAPRRPKVDLDAVAKAAAQTRAKIADELKTKMADPSTEYGPRRRGRGGDSAPAGPPADEGKPKPIDPNAIRKSVRAALGKMQVNRRDLGPSMPQQRTSGGPRRGRKTRGQIRAEKMERKARQRERQEAMGPKENEVRITEFVTVGELAEKLDAKPQDLIMKMMGLGVMATINQRLEKDTIELLMADYPDLEIKWLDDAAEDEFDLGGDDHGEIVTRPPVVTVMGHVDHGKTTLLDFLREANVTAGEAGGITQHIGAYQVDTSRGKLTFLDTPGHEAFTAMRARGARVTDIVVVVVAADDKVMPQTVEAIDHARASNCPIIIAINKIDLPAADPAGVKQELMQHNVLVEEFGGEVQCVEVSAKKGTNIEALLEAIALQAELLELTAGAGGRAEGIVIEARKEPGRGALFTVLVTAGTLRVGDPFVAGAADGRVRALLDEHDQPLEWAGPARPALVLGASDVPVAGDPLNVVESDSEAKEVASKRQRLQREQSLHAPRKRKSLEQLFDEMQAEERVELDVLIKGDVAGSVEALADSLMNLTNEKVAVNVIHRGVGGITDNDIMLAAASDAIVVGFHLRPDPSIRSLAKEQGVDLRLYEIIYEVVDDVRKAMAGLLAPIEEEVATGTAEVRELFRTPKAGVIAGSYVLDGKIKRNSRVRVVRDQVPIYEATISSLRRFKEDAREVAAGYECGIGVQGFDDLKVGDHLECYEVKEVAQEM